MAYHPYHFVGEVLLHHVFLLKVFILKWLSFANRMLVGEVTKLYQVLNRNWRQAGLNKNIIK